MEKSLAYFLIIMFSVVSVAVTIILSLVAKKKVFKYFPALIAAILAMIYCIIMTILQLNKYGRAGYIGILYIVILMVTSPAILLSLVTAGLFDIFNIYIKKN